MNVDILSGKQKPSGRLKLAVQKPMPKTKAKGKRGK